MEFKNEIGWLKQNTFEIKKNDVVVIGVDEGKLLFIKIMKSWLTHKI